MSKRKEVESVSEVVLKKTCVCQKYRFEYSHTWPSSCLGDYHALCTVATAYRIKDYGRI